MVLTRLDWPRSHAKIPPETKTRERDNVDTTTIMSFDSVSTDWEEIATAAVATTVPTCASDVKTQASVTSAAAAPLATECKDVDLPARVAQLEEAVKTLTVTSVPVATPNDRVAQLEKELKAALEENATLKAQLAAVKAALGTAQEAVANVEPDSTTTYLVRHTMVENHSVRWLTPNLHDYMRFWSSLR